MTSQKVTLDEILDNLAEKYDAVFTGPSEKNDEITVPDLETDSIPENIEINEDPTKISSDIIEKLRDHYGIIKLDDDCSISCDGRYGMVRTKDYAVKYIISKNVVEIMTDGLMIFDVLRFFEGPDQTFYAAPTYIKPFSGNNYYSNTESTRIHNAIQLMKDAENFFLIDDKT